MEIEPEKFRPQYEVHNFLGSGAGVKPRVGRFPETTKFLGLIC